MWFANAHIVDNVSGEVHRDRHFEIVDGVITRVQIDAPDKSSEVTDLDGQFVMPGIISCHTHLSVVFPFSETDENENPALTAYRSAQRAQEALHAGITTIRSVHEQNRADLLLRAAIKRGWSKGPRIFGAGRAISTPNGHGSGADCSYAEGFDGFYQAALGELEAGADHIKIFITGGLAHAGESPDTPEMTDDEIAGTVKAAHEHGTYVVAHSGESQAIMQALSQGVRSFEHIYSLDESTASALASRGAIVTPTLCVTRSESWMRANHFEEHSIQNALRASDRHLESVKRAIRANIPLVNGTDYPPGDLVDGLPAALHEMYLMHEAGLDVQQTLASISTTAAKLLNQSDKLGQVAPKFFGDFVTVEQNPYEDLDTLRNITSVYQGGLKVR
jgi:imidazolonepropionase-like amidohydrolase